MEIAIIGAGFTGLAAAEILISSGHQVTIFEKENEPGGLAVGFKDPDWKWPLERHYHHLFTSDKNILELAEKVQTRIIFNRPTTSIFYKGVSLPFDSPAAVLKYPFLNLVDKIRVSAVTLLLKLSPFLKYFEKVTSKNFLIAAEGQNAWKILWEPLFIGKFGRYADQISLAWFWARIKKRSSDLGYPEGGFQVLADSVAKYITDRGVKINYRYAVSSISRSKDKLVVTGGDSQPRLFDRVIFTLSFDLLTKTVPGLPKEYKKEIEKLDSLGAVNLVLSLKKPLLNGIYWLNINDRNLPFLAVVEHTNFVPKKNYHNEHLVYVGNYLPADHKYFGFDAAKLLTEFTPGLKKINPGFNSRWVNHAWVWKAGHAQPLVGLNHSRIIPPAVTLLPGLFIANIDQVYPWDRGTNYAVELGQKVARLCLRN